MEEQEGGGRGRGGTDLHSRRSWRRDEGSRAMGGSRIKKKEKRGNGFFGKSEKKIVKPSGKRRNKGGLEIGFLLECGGLFWRKLRRQVPSPFIFYSYGPILKWLL